MRLVSSSFDLKVRKIAKKDNAYLFDECLYAALFQTIFRAMNMTQCFLCEST